MLSPFLSISLILLYCHSRTHHKPFVPKHEETKIEFIPFSLHDESRAKRKAELEEIRKKREADMEAEKRKAEEEKKVI